MLVVTGPVASGKTEFLQAVARLAEGQNALVLSATAAKVERTLPLGVIRQLIRSADLPAELVERLGRRSTTVPSARC